MARSNPVEKPQADTVTVLILKTCPQGRPGDVIRVTSAELQKLSRYVDTGVLRPQPVVSSGQNGNGGGKPNGNGGGKPEKPLKTRHVPTREEFHAAKIAASKAGGKPTADEESEQIRINDLKGDDNGVHVQIDNQTAATADTSRGDRQDL